MSVAVERSASASSSFDSSQSPTSPHVAPHSGQPSSTQTAPMPPPLPPPLPPPAPPAMPHASVPHSSVPPPQRSHPTNNHQNHPLHQTNAAFWQPPQEIPPISSLLLREADAWRALLGLHASLVTTTQQVSRATLEFASNDSLVDEKRLNNAARETAYCSALTSLASQCDALFNEVMRLRTFRKARKTVEVETLSEIMSSHCEEVLAIGQTLATNGAINVATSTAELRAAIQAQRNQVSQLRAFLETLKTASTMKLPADAKLVLGVRGKDGVVGLRELDEIFKEVYSSSRELSETTLVDTMARLLMPSNTTECKPESGSVDSYRQTQSKHFARRCADRDVQSPAQSLNSEAV